MRDAFSYRGSDADTIAALATPPGEGGIAIVRVSGPAALDILRAVFRAKPPHAAPVSHRARLGLVVWPTGSAPAGFEPGAPLDEVLALPLLSPHSYTGEDTIELQGHGGERAAGLVLAACVAAGARPAGPGEFTRRAFLNGRLSLDQAEAVADLVHAEDELAARVALAQLRGGLRREIQALEAPLRALLARLEGSLEFAQDEPEASVAREEIVDTLKAARAEVDRLLALAPVSRRVREGVQVVLAGPPNAGKSSLFNALLGQERVLVDAQPGTTRDVVSAPLRLEGLTFMLHDTAGLRERARRVETLGIDRAREVIADADVILVLRDLSKAGQADELDVAALGAGAEAVVLEVGTKVDVARAQAAGTGIRIRTSAKTGAGLEILREALLEAADAGKLRDTAAAGILLNQRHQCTLMDCRQELASLIEAVTAGGADEEVVASLLAALLQRMGEISGRVFSEQLLGEIFSRFCVGK